MENTSNTNPQSESLEDEEINISIIDPTCVNVVEPDITFKIIVIGNSGVGKSCLSLKGTTGNFEDNYIATVGFDFFSFVCRVKDSGDKVVRLQIWDTCGQEGYRSLVQNFYRNTSLAVLVYSIVDINSFNAIEDWVKQLKIYSNPDIKIFLIGNKADLEKERVVSTEQGRKCKEDYNFHFFTETSAKTGLNSQEMLIKALKLLYIDYLKYSEMVKGKQKSNEGNDQITIERNQAAIRNEIKKKKKSNCC